MRTSICNEMKKREQANPEQPGLTSCCVDPLLNADKVDLAEASKTAGGKSTGGTPAENQSCGSSVGRNASTAHAALETAVTFARASTEDLGGVLSLLQSLQLPTAGVADHFDDFFVAREKHGLAAGVIGLERYSTLGLLRSAAVAPQLQRSGVGSKLTRLLIDFAKAEGLTELVLFTPTARDFFARFRFVSANRENYYAQLKASAQWGDCSCRNSAEFMRLEL